MNLDPVRFVSLNAWGGALSETWVTLPVLWRVGVRFALQAGVAGSVWNERQTHRAGDRADPSIYVPLRAGGVLLALARR
jgi:hypothetical protein